MGEVLAFPKRAESIDEEVELDLFSAVDFAIRDLRDIRRLCIDDLAWQQIDDCRQMLERALAAAVQGR